MHKDKKEGKLIDMDRYLYKAQAALTILNEQLCLVQSYQNSLKKIEEHNEQLDGFEIPFDTKKAFLNELNGILDDGKITGLDRDPDTDDDPMEKAFEENGGLEAQEQLAEAIDKYLNRHSESNTRREGK